MSQGLGVCEEQFSWRVGNLLNCCCVGLTQFNFVYSPGLPNLSPDKSGSPWPLSNPFVPDINC